MLLASASLTEKLSDHPWPHCQVEVFGTTLTLMSSQLASMVLAALLLVAIIVPAARRRQKVPTGGANALEVLVIFIRDMIARPSLRDQGDRFLPFLLTLFTFILGMNLMGLLPLEPLTAIIPGMPPIGGSATSIPAVTGALALVTLLMIVVLGLAKTAQGYHDHKGWPLWLSAALSPILWVKKLAPHVEGVPGLIMVVPLTLLEVVGVVARCFALMIRLFANMLSGHMVLAVFMMFIVMTLEGQVKVLQLALIGPVCIVFSVLLSLLELLVAGLQAYIFTFLTAIFLGLYIEPSH
ncbi:MAG: F0F1 ATP synthase subunit A [Phycisphaerae bacterium]|jgi:F-type H+-transporting ATPase subunit a